mmetsp:Transcript_21139/g.32419  ORF Transcript_21139/g.32419 Transcript_21139/m.32419 type:complete len:703 (+) Transcript_21139:32-2140(+)|eukprot:CAMPEP_0197316736 /NCGR_PEP_ID=MMETSP0891-20130614/43887_1 /TAXON_ID=44058 ORGANISM="Aureoumbra lagunensis, Strain CCMP1510" /NCGR_SAMPLE_ID=MMETSP0891 /ASSEMBLY_ACC=CAM_ASM_000534 /LENGTH=702 /DNA_ID=CAMNT_0042806353 /DNA_START=20 /DNA_END=2128 /DNA_ORIENTATION=+
MCSPGGGGKKKKDDTESSTSVGSETRVLLGRVCLPKSPTLNDPKGNYCLRDDILCKEDGENLKINSGGCPGHAIELTEPWAPQVYEHEFLIPASPEIDLIARYPPSNPQDKENGFSPPFGFAVNGIPFIFEDDGRSFVDECSGSTDVARRYHYRGLPVCLLLDLGGYAGGINNNIWPEQNAPSPLIGYARDGFPIFGPYDEYGDYANVNDCGFNISTKRYHLTINTTISCLMGQEVGLYSGILSAQACPLAGVSSAWCAPGVNCTLNIGNKGFSSGSSSSEPYGYLVPMFAFLAALVIVLIKARNVLCHFFRFGLTTPRRHEDKLTPTSITAITAVASVLLLVSAGSLGNAFYHDNDDKIENFRNEALGNFVTVIGVLYALIVDQILTKTHERLLEIRTCVAEELAGIHSVLLIIASLPPLQENCTKFNSGKSKIYEMLYVYTQRLIQELKSKTMCDTRDLALFYAIIPVLGNIAVNTGSTDYISRTLDSAADISRRRYQRNNLERKSLSFWFYLLNFFLANAMFFGIAIIYTGSLALDLTFCLITVVSIAFTTWLFAAMDDSYSNSFAMDLTDADSLLLAISRLRDPDHEHHGLRRLLSTHEKEYIPCYLKTSSRQDETEMSSNVEWVTSNPDDPSKSKEKIFKSTTIRAPPSVELSHGTVSESGHSTPLESPIASDLGLAFSADAPACFDIIFQQGTSHS